jgi:hypothetical protein
MKKTRAFIVMSKDIFTNCGAGKDGFVKQVMEDLKRGVQLATQSYFLLRFKNMVRKMGAFIAQPVLNFFLDN